jgi:pilus assembly protein FimV
MVTTRSAVKEPFLNFLIEADWSKGRLLREFTVLLDPPFYGEQPAPAETLSESSQPDPAQAEPEQEVGADDSAPASAELPSADTTAGGTITEPIALSGDTAYEPPEAIVDTQASSPPSSSEYVADESENIIQGDVLVVKGDTLWSIASRYKDDNHSMAQVMLAFQRANPSAFTNGNINNMKVGAVLRAPAADELDALDKKAAYAETLVQNGLWDEYVDRVSGVSPVTGGGVDGSLSSASDSPESQSELSLLVPGEGDSSSTGTGDSADLEQLRTKLALAEEDLDASRIENAELESRISELQARLSKVEELQKMVEIEDDSLAQLQADQSQSDSQTAAAVDDASDSSMADDDAVADTIRADEEALLEELLAEEAAAQAEEETALQQDAMSADEGEEVMTEEVMADEMAEEPLVIAEADGDQLVDDEVESAAVTSPPAPAIVTEPTRGDDSMLDGILPAGVVEMISSMGALFGNPIILAALGGVVLLLLVLVLVKRRKAAQDGDSPLGGTGDTDLFAGDDEDELTPIHLAEAEDPVETDIEVPSAADMSPTEVSVSDEQNEFAATAIIAAAEMPEIEEKAPSSAEQDDVLNEVDVYLAYGLYDNAEELLKSSLIEHPERADYRSKLLDTYFATKNSGSFVTEADKLKEMGDLANPYWDRVQIMGYELAPENALFSDAKDSALSAADLEIAKPQEADFDLGAGDEDDTNFSSTDFNLGEEEEADFGMDALLGEAGDLESTQQVSAVTTKEPAFDDGGSDESDELLELPDEADGELEFSMDDDAPAGEDDLSSGLAAEIELPEADMLGDFDLDDLADEEPEPATDAAAKLDGEDDIALDFDMDDVDGGLDPDDVVQVEVDEDSAEDDGIDLGMDNTATEFGDDDSEEPEELVLDIDSESVDEDISIIDFGGDDFEEPLEEMMPTVGDADDDEFVLDDDDQEEIKTGTFAPGDFDEPTAAIDSLANIDDLDDLMLPDDVDEVSTKLDLARAFIDMGDTEGARGSLEEVMSEGNADQKAEAKALLDQV